MRFDELIEGIKTCCDNDDTENTAYERIRYDIAKIRGMSHDAFDVKETFEEIAHIAYGAAWKEAEEHYARLVTL